MADPHEDGRQDSQLSSGTAFTAASTNIPPSMQSELRLREEFESDLRKMIEPFRTTGSPPALPLSTLIIAALVLSGKEHMKGHEILSWVIRSFPAYTNAVVDGFSRNSTDKALKSTGLLHERMTAHLPPGLEGFWYTLNRSDVPVECVNLEGHFASYNTLELLKHSSFRARTSEARNAVQEHLGWKREGVFRFLDLPPELRNRAYELAFDLGKDANLIVFNNHYGPYTRVRARENGATFRPREDTSAWPDWQIPMLFTVPQEEKLALASLSHQIRGGSLPLFYQLNSITLSSMQALLFWQRTCASHTKYLSNITISLDLDYELRETYGLSTCNLGHFPIVAKALEAATKLKYLKLSLDNEHRWLELDSKRRYLLGGRKTPYKAFKQILGMDNIATIASYPSKVEIVGTHCKKFKAFVEDESKQLKEKRIAAEKAEAKRSKRTVTKKRNQKGNVGDEAGDVSQKRHSQRVRKAQEEEA